MSVMSIGETAPPDRPLTVEDLQRMPDDGRRYELVDGRLDVSPAPKGIHNMAAGRLEWHLNNQRPKDYVVIHEAGVNLNADRTRHRIPDLAMFQGEDYEDGYFDRPPLLAVEVLSFESVFRDNHTKRREYAAFGIESYWIISPFREKPGITELRLEGGVYQEGAVVYGTDVFTTETPFPVSIVPYWLIGMDGDWREHIGGPGAGQG
ncbi:Uma2 family endonuclease [Nocardiopsis sp. CNT-189]|uniref:Uma2 family endonuclease n=1 Tax=Nocardiopsis oceanisediminis TaxID=2816862 RepID=UPI003B2BF189